MEIIVKAITDAREWQQAQDQTVKPTTQLSIMPSRFAPPLLAPLPQRLQFVMSMEHGMRAQGTVGLGVVFSGWRPNREIEPLSASRSYVSSTLRAEALAICLAVMHAASLNIKSLMILSDSLALVKLLKEGGSVPALFGILFDIYHFSSFFTSVSFSYVPRLSNAMADSGQSQPSYC